MRGRTGVMAAVAMCLVAGSAWAQSGPTIPGAKDVPVNQPIKAQGELERVKLAARKLQSPKMKHEWVAVTGMKQTWRVVVTPKAPTNGALTMTASAALAVDLQSNYYMFPPAGSEPLAQHVQLSFAAKKGARYNMSCQASTIRENGQFVEARTDLYAARYKRGGMVKPMLPKKFEPWTSSDGVPYYSVNVVYEHQEEDTSVQIRLMTWYASAYALIYSCEVQEMMPTTTYKPKTGDRA
jgi:hypothetical protein